MWKDLLRQLHHRAALFFIWFGDSYSDSWDRFSIFMNYGLRVLRFVDTSQYNEPTSVQSGCFPFFRRRCASVAISAAPEDTPERSLSPRDFAYTVNRQLDELIAKLETVDSATKNDQKRVRQRLSDYGAMFFDVFAGAILCFPETHKPSVTPLLIPLLDRFEKYWYVPNWPSFRQEVVETIDLLRADLLFIDDN